MMNRQIRGKTPARDICRELAGKSVAVRVRDTALAMYFRIGEDSVDLRLSQDDDPDVVITGSLFSLAGLAAGGGDDELRSGAIDLTGDVYTAQAFQRLLRFGRPDLEEELADVVGDVAARGIGDAVRGFGRWSREARETMRQNVSEYLQEESRAVPSRYEAEKFRKRVETLRDDVDRFEARLRRLESR
ncbi:MAG: SCP2 sterol-binding domain-containing protein [Woeseiaceae bacterium]|nr:SCP2 sterol-binding domain-containing protein [Woeseiaceae bacterium]